MPQNRTIEPLEWVGEDLYVYDQVSHDIIRHPKTLALLEKVKTKNPAWTRPSAIGLLILLRQYAKRYAPNGDVGLWPDECLAQHLDWEANPSDLVDALVDTGWLDRVEDPRVRLVVHGWPWDSVHGLGG